MWCDVKKCNHNKNGYCQNKDYISIDEQGKCDSNTVIEDEDVCGLVEKYAEEKKIESAVKTAQNFGQTKEAIIKYIVSEFMLNEESATQKVTLYWRK